MEVGDHHFVTLDFVYFGPHFLSLHPEMQNVDASQGEAGDQCRGWNPVNLEQGPTVGPRTHHQLAFIDVAPIGIHKGCEIHNNCDRLDLC